MGNKQPLEMVTPWLDNQRLRVQFPWRHDRFALMLLREERSEGGSSVVTDKPVVTMILSSVEGTTNDRWPASPPIQDLSIESRGERFVALGVGMAGKTHWSASIETLDRPHALRFDFACRLNELPTFLGSTFQIESAGTEAGSFAWEEVTGGKLVAADRQVQIVSDPPQARLAQWTARWQFTLCWQEAPAG